MTLSVLSTTLPVGAVAAQARSTDALRPPLGSTHSGVLNQVGRFWCRGVDLGLWSLVPLGHQRSSLSTIQTQSPSTLYWA